MYRVLFLIAISFPSSLLAQGSVDHIARAHIEHLKDLIASADKRYEQRFDAQEKAVGAALASVERAGATALAAAKEAVNKSEASTNDRLALHNGLQQRLDGQTATFPTRKEVEQNFSSLTERLNRLQERVDKGEGKDSGASALWGYIAGVFGLLIGASGIVLAISRRVERRMAT